MELDRQDHQLIAAIEHGLPVCKEPYLAIADDIGMTEKEVIARLKAYENIGLIKRFGIIVHHRALGYRSNGMAVWDVPDEAIQDLGHKFSEFPFVTLCYRRPRRLPEWPYNLFCMIHGKERDVVLGQVDELARSCGVLDIPHEVLFSTEQFKQRGAAYFSSRRVMEAAE